MWVAKFTLLIEWHLFGLVLSHINSCRLFNAKSSLFIYIQNMWFGLDEFYDISTIVVPLYTYISNIYDLWIYFVENIFKRALGNFLPTVKWFQQILVFNTDQSIQNYSFIYPQLNGSKYWYVSLTIQVEISHLYTVS